MHKEMLVVDDEPKLRKALSALFSQRGMRVETAATAQAALEQIRTGNADTVLLDLKLPDGSGLDVLSRLKEICPNVRVIVISAMSDEDTIYEAFERGASDYLTKPFDFDQCFYAAMGIRTVSLETAQADKDALKQVPVQIAQRYNVLPVGFRDGALEIAMADPLDVQRIDELKTILACEIKPVAGLNGSVLEAIQRHYGAGAGVSRGGRPDSKIAPPRQETDISASPAEEKEASGIIRLMNELIQHAYGSRATDLHLGVGPDGVWIRERVDGVLYSVPVAEQFRQVYESIVSRLKVMSSLDIAEHRLPQDGRVWFELGDTKLDLRISVLPTVHGENLAIRLLEPSRILRLEQLGLDEEQQKNIEQVVSRPTGMLLVTGPTGSGKSTSLYAFLAKLNTGASNIVTIEDPVEHELPGLSQIQVHHKTGLTFASGLRSMLRHDPDVMMVGEIRDQETASLAVRASLTGHLVLSTLHTNDAASGITRLLDLEIEPFLLCSTVSGILSQRLVRTLCIHCRASSEVDAASLIALGMPLPVRSGPVKVWRPAGCERCRNTGYHGRTAIFELLPIDHHIRGLVIKRASSSQIRQSAQSRGMQTLLDSGWKKAQEGITSFEELVRVLPPDQR